MLTERQLEYVVAIAETGTFTAAAERCHVAQSALSHQISSLERHLRTRLFERSSRSVRLTAAFPRSWWTMTRALRLAEPGSYLTLGFFRNRGRAASAAVRAFLDLFSAERHVASPPGVAQVGAVLPAVSSALSRRYAATPSGPGNTTHAIDAAQAMAAFFASHPLR
jgi:DNA-binding transcriptional LysR family regulator